MRQPILDFFLIKKHNADKSLWGDSVYLPLLDMPLCKKTFNILLHKIFVKRVTRNYQSDEYPTH